MSVLIEALSVVVPRHVLDAGYPGGTEGYLDNARHARGARYAVSDERLACVSFVGPADADAFVAPLTSLALGLDDGAPPPVACVDEDFGPAAPCPWLRWRRHDDGFTSCWLEWTDPGELSAPEGWLPPRQRAAGRPAAPRASAPAAVPLPAATPAGPSPVVQTPVQAPQAAAAVSVGPLTPMGVPAVPSAPAHAPGASPDRGAYDPYDHAATLEAPAGSLDEPSRAADQAAEGGMVGELWTLPELEPPEPEPEPESPEPAGDLTLVWHAGPAGDPDPLATLPPAGADQLPTSVLELTWADGHDGEPAAYGHAGNGASPPRDPGVDLDHAFGGASTGEDEAAHDTGADADQGHDGGQLAPLADWADVFGSRPAGDAAVPVDATAPAAEALPSPLTDQAVEALFEGEAMADLAAPWRDAPPTLPEEPSDRPAAPSSHDLPAATAHTAHTHPTPAAMTAIASNPIAASAPSLDIVRAHLAERGWRYSQDAGQPALFYQTSGGRASYPGLAAADESAQLVWLYTQFPVRVPEHRRAAAVELLTRANHGLPVGNFEFDYQDGEVRFKAVADTGDGCFSAAAAGRLLRHSLEACDRYHDALMQVIYGGLSPAEAVR